MKNTLPNFIVIGLGSLLIFGVSYAQFRSTPPANSSRSTPPVSPSNNLSNQQSVIQQSLTEDQLEEVAQRLSSRGYDINAMTATPAEIQRALKFFQAANHLPSTGVVDSATLTALGLAFDEEFERAPASID